MRKRRIGKLIHKNGKLLGTANRTKEELERDFWECVDVRGPNDCWEWKLYRKPKPSMSYGTIGYNRKTYYAHRLAWSYKNGPIPKGLHVIHKCDNPPCCNPTHLTVGTVKDNITDCCSKGRNQVGSRHYQALLTESKVSEIRRRYRFRGGKDSQASMAKEFGVSQGTIGNVIRGKTWKHVK